MATFTSHVVKVHNLCSPLLMPTTRSKYTISSGLTSVAWSQPHGGRLRLEQSWPNRQLEKVVERAKGGSASASASASEWGDEIVTEEELMGLGKLGGKCEETRGIAELLECLEREAIMGEDEGKEPTDYNRRAQIFHKSSRVFQSLKESSTPLP
ncbi:uncharacterized protein [Coffea arabica]|uniref:Uncharacterized protein n=1 Tax=Coffea arabica TaxID=13443 RepID=A0ABM4X0Q7_COFAR|nr:uncharacterized protein LOC113730235 [Coffea arabica]